MDIYMAEFNKTYGKMDMRIPDRKNSCEVIDEQMDEKAVKKKVLAHIKTSKTTDIETLHNCIRCDIRQLVKIIDELVAEGKIE